MSAPFEADLCPATGNPRMRFNFANGWSASIILRQGNPTRTRFSLASVAIAPTGHWGEGQTELLGEELTADAFGLALEYVREREAPSCAA